MEHERQSDQLIGELVAKVDMLMKSVSSLQSKVDELTGQANRGKGFLWGAMLLAGSGGAGLAEIIGRLSK